MKRLIQFYFRHRALCLILVCALALGAALQMPHTAFAAALDATDPDTTKLINEMNYLFSQLLKFMSMLLWPVLVMIGSLLDNDLIFGGAMGERLLGIWVQVRNLVNIIFVMILLAIAVYNVLGIGDDAGGIPLGFKAVMPKFVLALIAVNFSFLAVKVVLDFTNVMTGAVFAIPGTVVEQPFDMKAKVKAVICGTKSNEVPMKALWCNGQELSDRANTFFNKLDRSNITIAYAIQFGHAPQLKFIRDGLKGVTQLGFNIIFNLVLYAVYTVAFVALLIVLVGRLVVLWLVVVLSPLLALTVVLPSLKGAGDTSQLQTKFMASAIAPLTIGFVLSIGYIMLGGFSADPSIHGAQLAANSIDSVDPNALPTDILDLQQLMIAVGSIAVIWIGVFAATKDAVGSGIIESIKGYGEAFGGWLGKLPTLLQVIPTGKKEGRQPMSLMQGINTVMAKWRKWTQDREAPIGHDSPEQLASRGDTWRRAGDKSAKEFAESFTSDLGLLAHGQGRAALKDVLNAHGDQEAAKLITENSSVQNITDILYTKTHGDHAKALKEALSAKGLSQSNLAREVELKGGAGASGGGSGPSGAPTIEDIFGDTGKDNAAIANSDIFKGQKYKPEEIEPLRKLDDNVRKIALGIKDGKATNHLDVSTSTAINDFAEKLKGVGTGAIAKTDSAADIETKLEVLGKAAAAKKVDIATLEAVFKNSEMPATVKPDELWNKVKGKF